MKRAITLVAIVAALVVSGTSWARPQSDIPLQGSIMDVYIPPEIEQEGGEPMMLEDLCSPQVALSSAKSDYVALRQCDAENCIVKVVGKMAPGEDFWDHYRKSGDFIAHLFAGGIVSMWNPPNERVEPHKNRETSCCQHPEEIS